MMKKMSKKAKHYSSEGVQGLLQKRDPVKTARTRKRMLIAARIEDILNELGWKKKDLADHLGKNPSEVTKWLSGTHHFTTDTLSDIEHVTGMAIIPVAEKKEPRIIWQVVVRQEVKEKHGEFVPPKEMLDPRTLKSIVSKNVVHHA